MSFEKEIKNHYLNGDKKFLRHISVDCVIFGFHIGELKVLLVRARYAGKWALTGGFMLKEEHMDLDATRRMNNRTGLDHIYSQQFHGFSDQGRYTKQMNQPFVTHVGLNKEKSCMLTRIVDDS